jgi:hypothetical protein
MKKVIIGLARRLHEMDGLDTAARQGTGPATVDLTRQRKGSTADV